MKSRRDGWGGLILAAIALSGCGTAAPPAATLGPGQIGMIRFASRDVSNRDFLEGNQTTTPVVIAGHLQIPSAAGAARAPTVVLMHGCSGWSGADEGWAMTRFQRAWAPPGRRFAAYLAFYPGGRWFTLIDDVHLDARPVRIFHGMADDWTPVGPCRVHVDRARRAGSTSRSWRIPALITGSTLASFPRPHAARTS